MRYLFYLWVEIEDFNSKKLLNLVGCAVKYGQLNSPIKAHVLTERYNDYLYQYTFINFEYNNLDLFITCYYTFGLWRVTIINFFPPFNLLNFDKCLVITGACSLYRTSMVLSFHNITFTKKLIILDFYHTISVYVLNPTC